MRTTDMEIYSLLGFHIFYWILFHESYVATVTTTVTTAP